MRPLTLILCLLFSIGCPAQDSIILILTDDQRADTLWSMPHVQKRLVSKGALFTNAFASTPQCCPSRASLLSGGFYPHHTRVLTNTLPNGGVTRFDDSLSLGTLLKAKGYRTAYIGKYLNQYEEIAPRVPPGWDRFVATLTGESEDLSGGDWNRYRAAVDGQIVEVNQYVTDFIRDEARKFIRQNKGPIFLVVATPAPHTPATPPPEDVSKFADFVSPADDLEMQELARNQLRSLQSVDRLVKSLTGLIRKRKAMNRTRWIFASDNGFMWGEHGLYHKSKPYDPALRVPLVIRANKLGKTPRVVTDYIAAPLDIGQTVIAWGNSWVRSDGQVLTPCVRNGSGCNQWKEGVLLQHFDTKSGRRMGLWAGWMDERYKLIVHPDKTELFDRISDPLELVNIAPSLPGLVTTMRGKVDSLAGMVVVEESAPNAELGQSYSFQPTVLWGTPPYSHSVTKGSLPRGLRINGQTGEVYGVPSTVGSWEFIYKAKDSSVTPPHGYPQVFFRKYRVTVTP